MSEGLSGPSWLPPSSGWFRSASSDARFEVAASYPEDGHVVLAVSGEIDISSRSRLDSAIQQELDKPRCRRITIDFSRTEFFGSDGLRCLLKAHQTAGERSIQLRLIVNHVVDMVLRASGSRGEFEIESA